MGEQGKIGLQSTEKMSGYFTEGEEDFERGFEKGEKRKNKLLFELIITVDSVSDFVKLSGHKAIMEGTVSSKQFGEKQPIKNGEFILFQPDAMSGEREMIYSFEFTGDDEEDYFFYGYKVIHDDPGDDLADDMTTLFTRIYKGNSTDNKMIGSGILHFEMLDIPAYIASYKAVNAETFGDAVKAKYMFFRFCYGEVRDTYLAPLSPIYYTGYENLVLNGKVALDGKEPQDFFFFSGIHDKDFPWGDGGIFWDMGLIIRKSDGSWERFLLTDKIIENLYLDVEKGVYQYEGEIYQIMEGYQASLSQMKKSPLPDHLRKLKAKISIRFSSTAFDTVDIPFPLASNFKKNIPKHLKADIEELSTYLDVLGLHLIPHKVIVTEGSISLSDEDSSRTYNIQKDETLGEAEKSTFNSIEKPSLYYNYFCLINPYLDHIYVKVRSKILRKSRKDYLGDKFEEYLGKIVNLIVSLDLDIQKESSKALPSDKAKFFQVLDENLLESNNDHFPTAVFQRRIVSMTDSDGQVFFALEEDMDVLNLYNINSNEVVKVAAIKEPDKFKGLDTVLEKTGFFEQLDNALKQSGKTRENFSIFIKPNFMFTYSTKDISTFTDPELVEHLVNRIYKHGYRNLAVAEARSSYGVFFTNREVKTVAEYIGLKGKNYRIVDLSEDLIPYHYSGKLGDYYVNREWKDADFRISFAKNKTHSYAYYTLTIKNIYGALPAENKFLEYHHNRDIYSPAIEYISNFPIHFGLIDASVSADGPFGIFADKNPNFTNTIIGGGNIVAVDWIGAAKMGLDPMESDYMKQAVEQFGKPEIRLIGDREIYPNWVNVSDVIPQIAFGLDKDYYQGNLFYSVFSNMDPFFQFKNRNLGIKLLRVLFGPIKALFFQGVEDGILDADLNRKLYKQFEKVIGGRSRIGTILICSLAGSGLFGFGYLAYRKFRKK